MQNLHVVYPVFTNLHTSIIDSNLKMRRTEEENALFVELEKNIADEAEAREGYYRLLSNFSYLLSDRELDDFREIISEELKHTNLLNAMIQRRNGIIAEK